VTPVKAIRFGMAHAELEQVAASAAGVSGRDGRDREKMSRDPESFLVEPIFRIRDLFRAVCASPGSG
jgi:hypothetical protein